MASFLREPLHILGSGSIGLLWASSIRSAFPSFPVTLLLRSHHKPHIENQHVAISLTRAGNKRPRTVNVPAQLLDENGKNEFTIHNLIVSTKSYQAVEAVQGVLPCLEKSCRIIILCNGALSVRDELKGVLKESNLPPLVLATTTNGVYQEEPDGNLYRIVHAGLGKTFLEDTLPDLAQLWDQSGLNCQTISQTDMETLLWQKLAANCVINPLTAILNCPNGQLLVEPIVPQIMHEVIAEISQVARATIQDQLPELTEDALTVFVRQVIHDTIHNKSSMWQDVLKKQRTEVDHLNGWVIHTGRKLGIDCPANEDLSDRIRELTSK
jgi:2-dehydropantoate 2-reductase